MVGILAQSLDHWTPLTVAIVIWLSLYVASQSAVAVIRAIKGDKTQTSLETQMGNLLTRVSRTEAVSDANTSRLNRTEGEVSKINGDMIPSAAVDSMLTGKVLSTMMNAQQNGAPVVAPGAVPVPAPIPVPLVVKLEPPLPSAP